MKAISLDCLTLPDVSPVDLFGIAADAGFALASVWVQPPAVYPVMLASPAMQADIARAISASGVILGNLEVFNLNGNTPIAEYEWTLAFGAELGARSASAINFGPARPDIAERLAAFHGLCRRHGLKTYLEPISMGATRTLQEGVDLIREAGVDARLVVDCAHLLRTGGSSKDLTAIAPDYIGYVQVCDGPATIAEDEIGDEAAANRLYPNEGDFPLFEILSAVPSHAILGVETPSRSRLERGLTALERAREAFQAMTDIVRKVEIARERI